MKIINEKYDNFKIADQVYIYDDPENVLFFDIETTGLNKVTTSLYLIGCGFYREGILNTRFFFGDTPDEESILLSSFMDFAQNFKTIVHFNGTKFDLPYIEYKCKKYNVGNNLIQLKSLDLYKEIKPLRYLLFRDSMRQKCVEDFLGIKRSDKFNGGELIPVYYDYVETKNPACFNDLMMHNREDVLGMHQLFPILDYLTLSSIKIEYLDREINTYSDYYGDEKTELILQYKTDMVIPKPFSVILKEIYFKFDAACKILTIRVPTITGSSKHYYENYNDYFYLPSEGICIHKSMANGVDKSLKVKATRDNCFIEINGTFLPQFSILFDKTCGLDFKTRNSLFPISCIEDNSSAEEYGYHLLNTLFTANPKKIMKSKT